MKKFFVALLMLAAVSFAASPASSKNMAVGGWLQGGNHGEHAGLDFQMRAGDANVWDIYAHLYLSNGDNSLGAYIGYYWNFFLNMPSDIGRMGFYAGPAGGIGWWDEEWYHDKFKTDWDEGGLAIRAGVVGGFQWEFPVIPLQLFLELNPVGELHFVWWDDDAGHDDSEVQWKLPDFYFRIGLRFWF